ncbi:MAG: OmpA family protein [Magnetospirillum sp. WYHS-4]
MHKGLTLAALVAASVVTGACSGPYLELLVTHGWTVDGDFERARAAKAPEGSFNEHLRVKYLALADLERAEYDWMDAAYFARNAGRAGKGELVLPALPVDDAFWEPNPAVPELTKARGELLSALNGGGREKFPDLASTAQTMFDCWVQEQEENWQFDEIAACRKGFEDAMAAMRKPAEPPKKAAEPVEPPAQDYLVFFDFDKANVREDAASILDKMMKAREALGLKAMALIGHADRAGADAYNQRLSERRAASIKNWLTAKGVPAANMTTVGKGEADPRVKTPDGVREQENRRVEIHLK